MPQDERSVERGGLLARAALVLGSLGLAFAVLVIVTSFVPTRRPIFRMSGEILLPFYLGMFVVHIHTVLWLNLRRRTGQAANRPPNQGQVMIGLVLVIAALATIWLTAFFNPTVHKYGLPNNGGDQYALRLGARVTPVSYATYRNAQSLALRIFFSIPGIFYAVAAAVALLRLES